MPLPRQFGSGAAAVGNRRTFARARVRWQRLGTAALALFLACRALPQEQTDAERAAATNEVAAAVAALAIAAAAQEAANSQESMAETSATNQVATTNETALSNDVSRTTASPQTSGRESRSRRFRRSGSSTSSDTRPLVDNTNSPANSNRPSASLEYSAFSVIVDRNIFDPNRQPHRPGTATVRAKPKQVDYFALVGTMSYDKGTFAFFDGSGSDFRKVLKADGRIAGYKLTGIQPNAVRLCQDTNEIELRVGSQMRREDEGPWRMTAGGAPPSGGSAGPGLASSSSSSSPSPSSSGASAPSSASPADDEVIKRLMQRREKQ